jgi:hypothetical protein
MKSKKPKPLKNSVKLIRDALRLIKPGKKNKSGNESKITKLSYPKFAYTANELSAFTFSFDTFTILLKEGGVINYKPENVNKFRQWLIDNNVRDINEKSH